MLKKIEILLVDKELLGKTVISPIYSYQPTPCPLVSKINNQTYY